MRVPLHETVKQPSGMATGGDWTPRPRVYSPRFVGGMLLLAAVLVAAPWGGAFAQAPTVNGLFYGDGDGAKYVEYATSVYGSKLYLYFDAPTATLYVALVVNTVVNDNVFGQPASPDKNYMASVGWGNGMGQQRGADALTDSEFAQFTFEG